MFDFTLHYTEFNNLSGRVVKASAFGAVDLGLISSRVKPMTLKSIFTAFLRDAQLQRDSVENKPASLLVVGEGT